MKEIDLEFCSYKIKSTIREKMWIQVTHLLLRCIRLKRE
jgi:hypothetical protein